jgi:hypothetical protein
MIKRIQYGMRVRMIGHSFLTGVQNGAAGTVTKITGIPNFKHLIPIKWDTGDFRAVFRNEIEKEN